ncbi:MAG: type I 3-dehydroquinate dehydratase [archaeon]
MDHGKTKIVAVIAEKRIDSTIKKGYLTANSGLADIIQFNIDALESEQVNEFSVRLAKMGVINKPVILSIRNMESVHPDLREHHGYRNGGHDLNRIGLLRKGAEVNVEYIEMEHNFRRNIFFDPQITKLIIRYSDFEKTPGYDELRKVCDNIITRGADIINLETQIRENGDKDVLYKLMAEYGSIKPMVAVGLGDIGKDTWFEGYNHGACFAYGHTNSPWQVMKRGAPVPGMPHLNDLREKLGNAKS